MTRFHDGHKLRRGRLPGRVNYFATVGNVTADPTAISLMSKQAGKDANDIASDSP